MTRAAGCRVWDESGREYVDFVMALGAVALGYGHADVNRAATAAIAAGVVGDRKSTRLNSSHTVISYAVFCLKKKTNDIRQIHRRRHKSARVCLLRWCG